jgi:glycerol-3-phosphate dehydrogenase
MLTREAALAAFAQETFDVVVIGGGITGAGVALDAASRGYSVALVEKQDYSWGTSSRSSKLVHGGLRYLQKLDLGLVREALLERQLLVKLAPHLVTPLQILVPAFDGARPDRMTGIGLNMYDVMSTTRRRGEDDWSPARHRNVSGAEVLELLPALAGRNPTGGYLFYDCQTDDSRLVLTVLEEAERFGAVCGSRLEAVELNREGVRVRDGESGSELMIRAGAVINATGVWADRIRPDELLSEAEVPRIRPSRGTHITLSSDDLPLVAGAIVPSGGGRFIFALPWLGRSLLGTTDNNYDGDVDHVDPSADDIQYLLNAVNEFFGKSLGVSDVTGAFAGVRPLISSGDSKKSVDISRKAELYETSSGMITITGGKLTTFRRMAQMAVDALVERDGRFAPCRTHEIPLGQPVAAERLTRVDGVAEDAYEALADRYGHDAERVLAVAAERPSFAGPIIAGFPDLIAEAVYAVRHEQARSLSDVLKRRTRLGLLAGRELCAPGDTHARVVASVIGEELGWGAARIADEVAHFHASLGSGRFAVA